MLLRGAIRLFGHLMLALSVLGAGVIVEHSIASGDAGARLAAGWPPYLVYVGLGAGAWLLSVVAVGLIDLVSYLPRQSRDPYEDHPKMSPSVQPSHIVYRELPSKRSPR